ncbi:glycoside hydrolase [Mycena galericulata]|nr:glycoside hydrolase [Mycena galericulata]
MTPWASPFLETQIPHNTIRDQDPCNTDMNIVLQDMPVEPFPAFDPSKSIVYRYREQRGVNMGSLFVHESWMTPSLFEHASGHKMSELDIASGWNSPDCARTVLENHWNTLSSNDFSYLSSIGINTVRLPIGYWNLPGFCRGTPFSPYADVYHNSWAFIVRLINTAAKYDIGVLIDLHGAVGSQNGQPHSGISDGHVGLFNSPANIDKTLAVLEFLMQQLCNVTNVVGIEILNEPQNGPTLSDFYTRAISMLRNISSSAESFPLYIHDGFNLGQFSDYIANRSDFVVQDHHSYFVFTPEDATKSASQHTSDVETSVADLLASAYANQRGNLIIGEWSGALTPKSLSNESDPDAARRNFSSAQLEVYSITTAGWSFWAYKKEGCDSDPGWCFTAAVGTTLPSNFSPYRSNCNSPSSRSLLDLPPRSDVLSRSTGSLLPSPPTNRSAMLPRDWNVKRSTPPFRHRLAAIYHRRSKRDTGNAAEQQSNTKGYSDGWLAARLFCECDGSILGFVGQYILDSIKALGPEVIRPGTESYYSEGFYRGLSDGEASVN